MRNGLPRAKPRAAMTAHCRACEPLCVWIWGTTTMFGEACDDTHRTSSIVQPLLQRTEPTLCGQPSAEPKFQSRRLDAAMNPLTHAFA